MSIEFKKSKEGWSKDVEEAKVRDYSFKSASGEKVDLLYYPENNDDWLCRNKRRYYHQR